MIYVIRNSTTTNEENCFFKKSKSVNINLRKLLDLNTDLLEIRERGHTKSINNTRTQLPNPGIWKKEKNRRTFEDIHNEKLRENPSQGQEYFFLIFTANCQSWTINRAEC